MINNFKICLSLAKTASNIQDVREALEYANEIGVSPGLQREVLRAAAKRLEELNLKLKAQDFEDLLSGLLK